MADTGEDGSLDLIVTELSREVRALGERVARLERVVGATEARSVDDPVSETPAAEVSSPTGGPSSWSTTTTTALSRAATVCFLLVVALVLRTLTDGGILTPEAGAALGIGYSALLVCTGWALYQKRSQSAGVFAVSGALLFYTVILEVHREFHVLSLPTSYLLLTLIGGASRAIHWRFGASMPWTAGVMGMVVSGVALDPYDPVFPGLGALLLVASALCYGTAGRQAGWVRGFVLAASLGFWALWALKLNGPLAQQIPPVPRLGFPWFYPLLAASALLQWVTAYAGLAECRERKPGFLDTVLPGLTAAWFYAAAAMVAVAWHRSEVGLGLAGTAFAGVLFFLASRIARRLGGGARGVPSFSFAGCLLLVLALPLGGGHGLLFLPALSAVALALALGSARWASGGGRLVSYLLQMFVSAFAVAAGSFSTVDAPAPWRGLAAAAVAATSFVHYHWCRGHPPQGSAGFFARVDKTDDTAVALLFAALIAAFLALRVGVYEIVEAVASDPANVFQGAQSVMINLSALALVLAASSLKNTELRGVAIVVVAAGALKVFLFDLFAAHGLPLVASVFSFGLVAGVGALVLRRWPSPEGS